MRSWARLGPVLFHPSFILRDVGRDTNVFYSATDPQSDFTATVGGATDAALRLGERGFVTLRGLAEYVWFRRYAIERHPNFGFAAKGNLNLRALRFFAALQEDRVQERPSNEIDQRAKRRDLVGRAGAAYEISPGTALDLIAGREQVRYQDPDFVRFQLGRPFTLGDLLGRTETTQTLRWSQRFGGRSRVIVDLESRRYDFDSPASFLESLGGDRYRLVSRDARERRVAAGVEIEPGGVLAGTFRLGRSDFRPVEAASQKVRETIGRAELFWRLLGRVTLRADLGRDLRFSYYDQNIWFREDHAGLETVYYWSRMVGLEAGFDRWRLDYPTATRVNDPFRAGGFLLFEGRRQDRIRAVRGGMRFRLANRTQLFVRVSNRVRTWNVPYIVPDPRGGPARVELTPSERQTLVTTGVEMAF